MILIGLKNYQTISNREITLELRLLVRTDVALTPAVTNCEVPTYKTTSTFNRLIVPNILIILIIPFIL